MYTSVLIYKNSMRLFKKKKKNADAINVQCYYNNKLGHVVAPNNTEALDNQNQLVFVTDERKSLTPSDTIYVEMVSKSKMQMNVFSEELKTADGKTRTDYESIEQYVKDDLLASIPQLHYFTERVPVLIQKCTTLNSEYILKHKELTQTSEHYVSRAQKYVAMMVDYMEVMRNLSDTILTGINGSGAGTGSTVDIINEDMLLDKKIENQQIFDEYATIISDLKKTQSFLEEQIFENESEELNTMFSLNKQIEKSMDSQQEQLTINMRNEINSDFELVNQPIKNEDDYIKTLLPKVKKRIAKKYDPLLDPFNTYKFLEDEHNISEEDLKHLFMNYNQNIDSNTICSKSDDLDLCLQRMHSIRRISDVWMQEYDTYLKDFKHYNEAKDYAAAELNGTNDPPTYEIPKPPYKSIITCLAPMLKIKLVMQRTKSEFKIEPYPNLKQQKQERENKHQTSIPSKITYFLNIYEWDAVTDTIDSNKKEVICLPFLNQNATTLQIENNVPISGFQFPLKTKMATTIPTNNNNDTEGELTYPKDTFLKNIIVKGTTYTLNTKTDVYEHDNKILKWNDLLESKATTSTPFEFESSKILYPARPHMYVVEAFSKAYYNFNQKEGQTHNTNYSLDTGLKEGMQYDLQNSCIPITATKKQENSTRADYLITSISGLDLSSKLELGADNKRTIFVNDNNSLFEITNINSDTFTLRNENETTSPFPDDITKISYSGQISYKDFMRSYKFEYAPLSEPHNTQFILEIDSKSKHTLTKKEDAMNL